MTLRTLHSDQTAPDQVLGVYACPDCEREVRVPIDTGLSGGEADRMGESYYRQGRHR